MRLHSGLALALASLGGCAIFLVLAPWGDPCTFHGYSGVPCPSDLAEAQLGLRNAVFVVICLSVGFAAGKLSRSYRPFVGAASVLLAGFSAGIVAHMLYRLDAPLFTPLSGYALGLAVAYMAGLALLGALGAIASMWSPNNRWRGP
jgi:hypothetical protein